MWKSKLLATTGKAQLIRSVLHHLPMYYLSIFKLPNYVARKLISIYTKFFFEGEVTKQKLAIMS